MAALRHPNVVQIYDVGESDGRPYFTMELVEGGNLASKVKDTPQPARDAAGLLATLARATQAAHVAGIIHRDLKPAIVLISDNSIPKISDFGLARRLNDGTGLTRTGTAIGTPNYMAPEQAGGKPGAIGPAVDIYGLGAILYQMLTARPPFLAETPAATIQQVISQEPVPPSRLNSKVPRDLETICMKCLHKEPQLRYATAAALADDLDCFLRGETISARPEGRLGRLIRRVRRQPVRSVVVAVAVLGTFFLLGTGLWLISERATEKWRREANEAAIEQAVKGDLRDMVQGLNNSSWPESRAALERARTRLGDRESVELRRLIEQGARDLEFAARLDDIRINNRATDPANSLMGQQFPVKK